MKDVRKKLKARVEKIVKRRVHKSQPRHERKESPMEKESREESIGRFAFREEAERISKSSPEIIVSGKPHWLSDVQKRLKELEAKGEFNLQERERWELSKLRSTLRKYNMSMNEVHPKVFE